MLDEVVVRADLPSMMINQPVPEFDLPPLLDRERGLATADLAGEVRLVNFFASWCVACRVEHPLLTRGSFHRPMPGPGLPWARVGGGWRFSPSPYGQQ